MDSNAVTPTRTPTGGWGNSPGSQGSPGSQHTPRGAHIPPTVENQRRKCDESDDELGDEPSMPLHPCQLFTE